MSKKWWEEDATVAADAFSDAGVAVAVSSGVEDPKKKPENANWWEEDHAFRADSGHEVVLSSIEGEKKRQEDQARLHEAHQSLERYGEIPHVAGQVVADVAGVAERALGMGERADQVNRDSAILDQAMRERDAARWQSEADPKGMSTTERAGQYIPFLKQGLRGAARSLGSAVIGSKGAGALLGAGKIGAGAATGAVRGAAAQGVVGASAGAAQGAGAAARGALSATGGSAYGAIGLASAQEANRAITEGADAGLKGSALAGYVASQGVIEALPATIMQKIGLGGVEAMIAGPSLRGGIKAGILEAIKSTGQEIPEELITEIGHAVASEYSGLDPKALDNDRLASLVADTVLQTVIMGAGAGALKGAQGFAEGDRQRLASLQEARAKGFVSAEDAKKLGVEGATRKERLANADAAIQELQTQAASDVPPPVTGAATPPLPTTPPALPPTGTSVPPMPVTGTVPPALPSAPPKGRVFPTVGKTPATVKPPLPQVATDEIQVPVQGDVEGSQAQVPVQDVKQGKKPAPEAQVEPTATETTPPAQSQEKPWDVVKGNDGKLYRLDPSAKTGSEKLKTRQAVDPSEGIVLVTKDQFGKPTHPETLKARQEFADKAKPGAVFEFTSGGHKGQQFEVKDDGSLLELGTRRSMSSVQEMANTVKPNDVKWNSAAPPTATTPVQSEPKTEQRVYRDMGASELDSILNPNTSSGETFGGDKRFWSDNPDLAISQSKTDKGFIVELNPAGLKMQEHAKPGTAVPGVGKEYTTSHRASEFRSGIASVVIRPDATGDKSSILRAKRFLEQQVKDGLWEKSDTEDGGVRYSPKAPSVESALVPKETAVATSQPKSARAMNPDEQGRPVDGKPIIPGDKFLTNTGRETTPYPKYDGSTNRKAINAEKKSQQWLMENAIAEAESRGDEFNARTFRSELEEATKGKLPQASKDSATLYVFGDYVPKVPKPFLKDMGNKQGAKADSASVPPKPEPEPKKSLNDATEELAVKWIRSNKSDKGNMSHFANLHDLSGEQVDDLNAMMERDSRFKRDKDTGYYPTPEAVADVVKADSHRKMLKGVKDAESLEPDTRNLIADAVSANGGFDNNSADAVDAIHKSLYEPGKPTPSHADIRAVMQWMKNEAGEKPATKPPQKQEPIQTVAGKMTYDEFESKGYAPEQVTQQDWVNLQKSLRRSLGQPEESGTTAAPHADYEEFHKDAVRRAVKAGDDVDSQVLEDYPDIKWQAETKTKLESVPALKGSKIEADEKTGTAKVTRSDGLTTTIHFNADEELAAAAAVKGRNPESVHGWYVRKPGETEWRIYLRSDADHSNILNHEVMHWLEDAGVVTAEEVEQYGGREAIAEKYGKWVGLKQRKKDSVFQRIYDALEPLFSSQRRFFEEVGTRQKPAKTTDSASVQQKPSRGELEDDANDFIGNLFTGKVRAKDVDEAWQMYRRNMMADSGTPVIDEATFKSNYGTFAFAFEKNRQKPVKTTEEATTSKPEKGAAEKKPADAESQSAVEIDPARTTAKPDSLAPQIFPSQIPGLEGVSNVRAPGPKEGETEIRSTIRFKESLNKDQMQELDVYMFNMGYDRKAARSANREFIYIERQPEPIPEFTRTTPEASSITRQDRENRINDVREKVAEIAQNRRAKQKEPDGLRRNANRKRSTVKEEINRMQGRENELLKSIQRDEEQAHLAKLEDALESPISMDHYLAGMMARAQVMDERSNENMYRDKLNDRAIAKGKSQGLDESDAKGAALAAINSFSVFDDRSLGDIVSVAAGRIRESRTAQAMGRLFPNPVAYGRQESSLPEEQKQAFAERLRDAAKDDKGYAKKIDAIAREIELAIESIRKDKADTEAVAAKKKAEEKAATERDALSEAREKSKRVLEDARIDKALKSHKMKPEKVIVRREGDSGPVVIVKGVRKTDDKKGELYPNGLILHPSFGEDVGTEHTITHARSGLAFPFSGKKTDMKALVAMTDLLGIEFNVDTTDSGALPSDLQARMKQVNTAWDNSDVSQLSEEDQKAIRGLAKPAETDIGADIILGADELGANGIPPGLDKTMTTRGLKVIKDMAQAVPEFSYDPVFTVQGGKLVFRDGYVFQLEPEAFNIHPSELKDGQTVGINLEDLGIKRNTPQDVVAQFLKGEGIPNVTKSKGGHVSAGSGIGKASVLPGKEDNDWDVAGGNQETRDKVTSALKKIRWVQPGQSGEAATDIVGEPDVEQPTDSPEVTTKPALESDEGGATPTEDDIASAITKELAGREPKKRSEVAAERKEDARKRFLAAGRKLIDPSKPMSGLDPSKVKDAVDVALAAIDYGVAAFDEFVSLAVESFGEKGVRDRAQYLEEAARQSGIEGVTSVADVLDKQPAQAEPPIEPPPIQSSPSERSQFSGIKRERLEMQADAAGLPHPTETETVKAVELVTNAVERLTAESDKAIQALATDVITTQKPITVEETADLLASVDYHKRKMEAAIDKANEYLANGEQSKAAEEEKDVEIHKAAMRNAQQAARDVGRRQFAYMGHVLQVLVDKDGEAHIEQQLLRANLGQREYDEDGNDVIAEYAKEMARKLEQAKRQQAQRGKQINVDESLAAANEKIKQLEDELKRDRTKSRKARGSGNRIVTQEAKDAAVQRIRKVLKGLGSTASSTPVGAGLQMLPDAAIVAGYVIESGARKLAEFSRDMVAEVGDWVVPHLNDLHRAARAEYAKTQQEGLRKQLKDAEDLQGQQRSVGQLAKEILAETRHSDGSFISRDELIDLLHKELEKVDSNITRQETMDLFSGYGKYAELSKDDLEVAYRDRKGEARELGKIEDMKQKHPPKPTGKERHTPSDEERQLHRAVRDLKKQGEREKWYYTGDGASRLKGTKEAIKTRLRHEIQDLDAQIKISTKTINDRTEPLTDDEIDALREQRNQRKQRLDLIVRATEEAEAARWEGEGGSFVDPAIEDYLKVLDRQIAALKKQLATKNVFPKPTPSNPEGQAVDIRKLQIEALNAEKALLRKLLNPNYDTNRKLLNAEKAAEREVAKLEKERDEGFKMKEKPEPLVASERLRTARGKLAALREQRLKELEDEYALRAAIAQSKRNAANIADRIARGDFAPRKRKPVRTWDDPAWKEAKSAELAIRNEFAEKLAEYEFQNMTRGQTALFYTLRSRTVWKAIMTGLDQTALGLQGGIAMFTNPVVWAKALIPTAKSAVSAKQRELLDAERESHHDYERYKNYNLALREHNKGKGLNDIEFYGNDTWIDKIPGVAVSERTFSTFLNELRFNLMRVLEQAYTKDGRAVSEQQGKALARVVNAFTLAYKPESQFMQGAMSFAGEVFWAPSMYVARAQLAFAMPVINPGADSRVRQIAAMQYVKAIVGMAALTGALRMLLGDDDDELTPVDADYYKVKSGNVRMDMTSGMGQMATFAMRALNTASAARAGGPLWEGKGRTQGARELVGSFASFKVNPWVGAGLDFFSEKDVIGRPTSIANIVLSNMTPLSVQTIAEAIEEEGAAKGLAWSVPGITGRNLSIYDRSAPKSEETFLATTKRLIRQMTGQKTTGLSPDELEKWLGSKVEWDTDLSDTSKFLSEAQMEKAESRRNQRIESIVTGAVVDAQTESSKKTRDKNVEVLLANFTYEEARQMIKDDWRRGTKREDGSYKPRKLTDADGYLVSDVQEKLRRLREIYGIN